MGSLDGGQSAKVFGGQSAKVFGESTTFCRQMALLMLEVKEIDLLSPGPSTGSSP
jgi:hypothetical protein